jgi:hypothetical protein
MRRAGGRTDRDGAKLELRDGEWSMNLIEYQPLPVTAVSEHELNLSALLQLRALDEMERLARMG